ncbi:MAG: inorganic diphosphatase [Acidimicrobiia bacterium]|nr:inorganic diphosphatase [Acidimicrobiia bacterium]
MDESAETIDVLVEIPRGSRNKYEWDGDIGRFRLDRRLFSATTYPAEYGFIPDTLGEDGDELDALVFLDEPTFPGCVVRCRPVGVFHMEDEKGPDAKVLCVLADDPRWDAITDLGHLGDFLLAEVEHFFEIYKQLEPGKSSSVQGFGDRAAAVEEIRASRRRAAQASSAEGAGS